MAPHSRTLAWKIPWTEEPGGLQSMGSLRIGHDWVTSLSLFTFMHWRRKWQPLQCSCLENPRDRGALWAAVSAVAQSWTRLKRLSSSSSNYILHMVISFHVSLSIHLTLSFPLLMSVSLFSMEVRYFKNNLPALYLLSERCINLFDLTSKFLILWSFRVEVGGTGTSQERLYPMIYK